jgi:hypothetical protein
MKIAVSVCAIALCVPITAYSQEHDYSLVVVPSGPNTTYREALIIDRRTGDLWDYINQSQIGKAPGGTTLLYVGKVAPGSAPGQVIVQDGFGKPPIPGPAH